MPELSVPTGAISGEAALTVDGRGQPALGAALLAVAVEETSEGLCRCEARFGNWEAGDFRYFDRALLEFGKDMTVELGAGDGLGEVFAGKISALEGQFVAGEPPTIVVLAEDRLAALRQTRRSRVFEDMADADIFAQIAREHGLQPEVDVTGPTHRAMAQVNQTDLAFIRERARALDADVWAAGGTLRVQARPRRAVAGDLSLALGGGLLEFSVTADLANQPTSVVVSGWDVAAKEAISAEADEAALGAELGGDTSGAAVQRSAFGERVERIVHRAPLDGGEARALAESAFRARARRFVFGSGLARGDARLRVGLKLRIDGLGPLFSGEYTIVEARHVFQRGPDGGYTTEFSVERAGLGGT